MSLPFIVIFFYHLFFFFFFSFFFFNDTATTEIYTLSLHDALPISWCPPRRRSARRSHGSTAHYSSRPATLPGPAGDRKSTRLNSSHSSISYAVFCLKKKKNTKSLKRRHNLIHLHQCLINRN